MTIANLRNAVDAKLAALWPRIVTRQEAFFAANGRYHQFKFSHSAAPQTLTADSAEREVIPDTLGDLPTNESSGWTDVPQFPAALPYRIRMDAWEDEIHGFTGVIQVRHNANLFERSKSFPDDRFTEAWHQVAVR